MVQHNHADELFELRVKRWRVKHLLHFVYYYFDNLLFLQNDLNIWQQMSSIIARVSCHPLNSFLILQLISIRGFVKII